MVFVLDTNKNKLNPCHPAKARILLNEGKAAIFRMYPFTIILKKAVKKIIKECEVKIDPGSKHTGIAVLQGSEVVFAAEIEHRGEFIHSNMNDRRASRRNRRSRTTRYRKAKFLNRTKDKDWLAPSLESVVSNVLTWTKRLMKYCNITKITMEYPKFDTQKMQNPEISGIEYQQGELQGYEVKEYLLEKYKYKCVYCNKDKCKLQIEHVVPKSKAGSDRISNLVLACDKCNSIKNNRPIREFLSIKPELLKKILSILKKPLKSAGKMNHIKSVLYKRLLNLGLPIEIGTGAQTKYNELDLVCLKSIG